MSATPAVTAVELPELRFASGLPGFPDARRFALVRLAEGSAFFLLRSLDEPELEFVVVPPHLFFADYEPEIDDATAERLGLREASDALLLAIVSVGERVADSTVNLAAPVVINRHTRDASQMVLVGSGHSVRAPLLH